MQPSIYVTIRYDAKLEKITKVRESPVVMSSGQAFPYFLMSVFLEHPEIDRNYKPGELGFLINGVPPTTHTVLRDGDVIDLSAHK